MSLAEKYRHLYPGHALVIAACIMEKYSSLEAATERKLKAPGSKEYIGYGAALGDGDIPGAGGCVYSALRVLSMDDIEAAIAHAEYCWEGECSGAYANRFEEGVNAAKEVEAFFREKWLIWKGE